MANDGRFQSNRIGYNCPQVWLHSFGVLPFGKSSTLRVSNRGDVGPLSRAGGTAQAHAID